MIYKSLLWQSESCVSRFWWNTRIFHHSKMLRLHDLLKILISFSISFCIRGALKSRISKTMDFNTKLDVTVSDPSVKSGQTIIMQPRFMVSLIKIGLISSIYIYTYHQLYVVYGYQHNAHLIYNMNYQLNTVLLNMIHSMNTHDNYMTIIWILNWSGKQKQQSTGDTIHCQFTSMTSMMENLLS